MVCKKPFEFKSPPQTIPDIFEREVLIPFLLRHEMKRYAVKCAGYAGLT